MSSESLHERYEDLRPETRDMHRAIVSLMEELEAIDWYQQRIDATGDPELAAVLGHNRDEEIEHAMMVLEWIRRHNATFDDEARTYLFSRGPILEVEEEKTGAGARGDAGTNHGQRRADAPAAPPSGDGSLGIGSLKLP